MLLQYIYVYDTNNIILDTQLIILLHIRFMPVIPTPITPTPHCTDTHYTDIFFIHIIPTEISPIILTKKINVRNSFPLSHYTDRK